MRCGNGLVSRLRRQARACPICKQAVPTKASLEVSIPGAGKPTGVVFNPHTALGDEAFVISNGIESRPAIGFDRRGCP